MHKSGAVKKKSTSIEVSTNVKFFTICLNGKY